MLVQGSVMQTLTPGFMLEMGTYKGQWMALAAPPSVAPAVFDYTTIVH